MLQNTCIIITETVNGGQVLNVRTDRQIQQVRQSRPISTHSLPHLQTMLLHCRARGLACPYAMECKDRTALAASVQRTQANLHERYSHLRGAASDTSAGGHSDFLAHSLAI